MAMRCPYCGQEMRGEDDDLNQALHEEAGLFVGGLPIREPETPTEQTLRGEFGTRRP